MASRYGPAVRPSGVDPLAVALERLHGSFSQAAEGARERERQKVLDAERQEERTFERDQTERANELGDVRLALQGVRRGQAPTVTEDVSGPTLGEARRSVGRGARESMFVTPDRSDVSEFGTLRRMLSQGGQQTARMPQMPEGALPGVQPPSGPAAEQDPYAAALAEAQTAGRGAFPTEPPKLIAAPGAFVPGVGFTPRALYEERPEFGLQRPDTVERSDPRFEQLTENFYREAPDDEVEELVQQLVAEGIPENRARILAAQPALLDNQLFPDGAGSDSPIRWERQQLEDGTIVQVNPVTGEVRPLNIRGRMPGDGDSERVLTPKQQHDAMLSQAAGEAAYMVRQQGVTPDGVIVELQKLYPGLTPGEAAGLVVDAQDDLAARRRGVVLDDAGEIVDPAITPTDRPRGRGGASSSGGQTPAKHTITQDQADYLRDVVGWSDEQIAESYRVQGR